MHGFDKQQGDQLGQHHKCPFVHPFFKSPRFHRGFKLLFGFTENRDIADCQDKQFDEFIRQRIAFYRTGQINIRHIGQHGRNKQ